MRRFIQISLMLLVCTSGCYAGISSFEPFSGRLSPKKFTPNHQPEEYFEQGQQFLAQKRYRQALLCFGMILHHFPSHALYAESQYLSGLCYFKNNQPDLADKAFNAYLQLPEAEFSEELFTMKYAIARSFAEGKRKHIFLLEGFPKLVSAKEDALKLYDEVLTAFPNKELGARALYHKGELLMMDKEYSEAIKTLKKLTVQFPQHSLSPHAFLRLSEIYSLLAKREPHNDHYLQLARVNAAHMRKQHPNHPLNQTVAQNVHKMCERYAAGLYDTGRFYEKKKKNGAAKLYYTTAVENYPDTSLVAKCHKRLERIAKRS